MRQAQERFDRQFDRRGDMVVSNTVGSNGREAASDLYAGSDLVVRNPILHDAHPDDLMAASEELRERTMSLEPPAPILGLWIASFLMSAFAFAVVGTFVYRDAIKAYFGLH